MSNAYLSAAWKLDGISSTQRLVLVALADLANKQGVCWPGLDLLMARTCLTDRAVQKAIIRLTELGLIAVKTGGGRSKSNIYAMTFAPAVWADEDEEDEAKVIHKKGDTAPNRARENPERRSQNPERRSLNPEPDSGEPIEPIRTPLARPALGAVDKSQPIPKPDLATRQRLIAETMRRATQTLTTETRSSAVLTDEPMNPEGFLQ